MKNQQHATILVKLQEIIAELTGIDPEEVQLDSHFEDDLDIIVNDGNLLNNPFYKIITRVNREFEIQLDRDTLSGIEHIQDLISLVADEMELG